MTKIDAESPVLEVMLSDEDGEPLEGETPIEITGESIKLAVTFAIETQDDWLNLTLSEIVDLWIAHLIESAIESAKQQNP